ncbi:hypothetical protein CVT26_005268 [Gymnopilus dilepis]|uniref:Uncharacterized protein n=1 Tax=Gymnopilus dilepis TaxID=231916 RepID=A0A409YVM3_9AGAR|nr:hypothetical protein CVT26_005268 [Gymnopilus dilepis]
MLQIAHTSSNTLVLSCSVTYPQQQTAPEAQRTTLSSSKHPAAILTRDDDDMLGDNEIIRTNFIRDVEVTGIEALKSKSIPFGLHTKQ